MWSIGNEVPNQRDPESYKTLAFLQDICHRLDPTRPVTVGIDQADNSLHNGFAATIDIPGFNYRLPFYQEAYDILPQGLVLGSETASTVSSRGVYKFPVELKKGAVYPDMQSSGYDTEACPWSNIPDLDFAMADDNVWEIGQFVWTGFDYLGEPTPYYDNWPSHSSYFGIIDLASLPKDRYYLYRSIWNKRESTLHILPHWTWKDRKGQVTPVYVYTSYPEAELFINGKSQGRQHKWSAAEAKAQAAALGEKAVMHRYRLMWEDVKYEPGEVKVVAYDANGNKAEEKVIRKILADGELRAAWEAFTSLSRTERAKLPDGRPNWRRIPAKKRWIDPLVQGKGRLSSLDPGFREEAEAFVQSPLDHWVLGA